MNIIYQKPMIFENDDLSEGIYMASGTGSGCYTSSGQIMQIPETGRNTYVIQINGHHNNANHTSDTQTITVSFNQVVNYVSCAAARYSSGNGTSTIVLIRQGFQNGNDSIGFGDLSVTSAAGLQIVGVSISDGH